MRKNRKVYHLTAAEAQIIEDHRKADRAQKKEIARRAAMPKPILSKKEAARRDLLNSPIADFTEKKYLGKGAKFLLSKGFHYFGDAATEPARLFYEFVCEYLGFSFAALDYRAYIPELRAFENLYQRELMRGVREYAAIIEAKKPEVIAAKFEKDYEEIRRIARLASFAWNAIKGGKRFGDWFGNTCVVTFQKSENETSFLIEVPELIKLGGFAMQIDFSDAEAARLLFESGELVFNHKNTDERKVFYVGMPKHSEKIEGVKQTI